MQVRNQLSLICHLSSLHLVYIRQYAVLRDHQKHTTVPYITADTDISVLTTISECTQSISFKFYLMTLYTARTTWCQTVRWSVNNKLEQTRNEMPGVWFQVLCSHLSGGKTSGRAASRLRYEPRTSIIWGRNTIYLATTFSLNTWNS